jgi:hypothetical protein
MNRAASAVFFIMPTVMPGLTGMPINLELTATARGISESKQKTLMLFVSGILKSHKCLKNNIKIFV